MAIVGGFGFELVADVPIGRRPIENASQQTPEIESRATDEQRYAARVDD